MEKEVIELSNIPSKLEALEVGIKIVEYAWEKNEDLLREINDFFIKIGVNWSTNLRMLHVYLEKLSPHLQDYRDWILAGIEIRTMKYKSEENPYLYHVYKLLDSQVITTPADKYSFNKINEDELFSNLRLLAVNQDTKT